MYNYLELRKEELKKRGNKGFTLMEMLIVVAIIAVLISIAIPVFTSQLENSREATDAANIRSAYAEVTTKAISNPTETAKATVTFTQAQDDWQNGSIKEIAGVATGKDENTQIVAKKNPATIDITYDPSTGDVTIGKAKAKTSFTS